MTKSIVIRLSGDSGDGVQIVGEQLTISAAMSGRDVRTLPDFPAEIRAPAGTVAGVSGFQLAMSDKAIFTAGETLDVLVALNPAALKHSLSFLKEGGLLIINEDSFQDKDWLRAGLPADYLTAVAELYQVISLPLIKHTLMAVEGIDIAHTQAKKSKNFYILGLVLWLFDLSEHAALEFIVKKFKNKEVARANEQSLKAGYNYAMTLELARSDYAISDHVRAQGAWRQVTGVEAVGLAIASVAVASQTPMLVSGYPITPASAILHESAKLASYGVQLLQAEDEIAAICACLGAAFGGRLALTCTSGPGLDLKSESLGLAVMTELPLVVIDVQRAGASTGLPTKTSQSDLRQALYGRHGEAPLPVMAAVSPSDCFETVMEAFRIATRYMTPVLILLDAYLANAAEPWLIPDIDSLDFPTWTFNRTPKPFTRDTYLARSWNVPGTPGHLYQLGGLEKQGEEGRVSYEADNHQQMINLRAQKIAGVAEAYGPLKLEGHADASCLIIGWGSTYGAIKAAVQACAAEGLLLAHIQLRHLNPLPDDLAEYVKRFDTILVAELNSGQLCAVLRSEYLINARAIAQTNGLPFTVSALVNAIKAEVCYESL